MTICPTHGEIEFVLNGKSLCCPRCRSERVIKARRRKREILVQEHGGRCCICGYDKYIGALDFHHIDPAEKKFGLSRGPSYSLAKLREEAAKCVLLCKNCHHEVEAGVTTLPISLQPTTT